MKTAITLGARMVVILVATSVTVLAQNYSNNFDFVKVNTKAFTVNTGANNQEKFRNSSIYTSVELANFAQQGTYGSSKVIGQVAQNIKIKARKLSYTPVEIQVGAQSFKLRLIFVRPDDAVKRPVVLLSPGANADFNNWYNYLALGVPDYLARGYAVAFYENWNNKYVIDAAQGNPGLLTNLPISHHPEAPFYALYQFANAAAQYVVKEANTLNIRTDQMFAGGNSAGGFSAYALALASPNNFTDPIFQVLGSKTHKSHANAASMAYQIRAIGILGSGLFLPSARMGDLIDPTDLHTSAVIWHGATDSEIHLDCCTTTPCSGPAPLPISMCGGEEVAARLCQIGARPQLKVNCFGGHQVITQVLSKAQAGNLPTANTLLLIDREFQQIMDIQQGIVEEFKKTLEGQTTTTCSTVWRKPHGYPNLLQSNWHLVNSASCAAQLSKETSETLADQPTERTDSNKLASTAATDIYPNPTRSAVTIQSPQSEIVKVQAFDAQGHCVLNLLVEPTHTHLQDISGLAQGIYWVQTITANGLIHTNRVVKIN